MIIQKTVEVYISNNGSYWRTLGYGRCKQGDKILVLVKHLPPNSNKKVKCKCDECGKHWIATYQSLNREWASKDRHRCFKCNRNLVGSTCDRTKMISGNKDRIGPKHPRWNPDKKAFQAYAYKVRRLTEAVYNKNKQVINPDDLPRTLCGVEGGYQLDHKISIKEGFTNQIAPEVMSSIDNLQMLPWRINRQKHSKENTLAWI